MYLLKKQQNFKIQKLKSPVALSVVIIHEKLYLELSLSASHYSFIIVSPGNRSYRGIAMLAVLSAAAALAA